MVEVWGMARKISLNEYLAAVQTHEDGGLLRRVVDWIKKQNLKDE